MLLCLLSGCCLRPRGLIETASDSTALSASEGPRRPCGVRLSRQFLGGLWPSPVADCRLPTGLALPAGGGPPPTRRATPRFASLHASSPPHSLGPQEQPTADEVCGTLSGFVNVGRMQVRLWSTFLTAPVALPWTVQLTNRDFRAINLTAPRLWWGMALRGGPERPISPRGFSEPHQTTDQGNRKLGANKFGIWEVDLAPREGWYF